MVQFINPRYLSISLGKKKGFLVIPADKSGYIYVVDEITALLQINPSAFIAKFGLIPKYRMFWISEISDIIVSPCDKEGRIDLDSVVNPDEQRKAETLVSAQILQLNNVSQYFPTSDITLLAIKAISLRDNVTTAVAAGNAQRLLDQLDKRDVALIKAMFDIEVNSSLAASLGLQDDQMITIDLQGSEVETIVDEVESLTQPQLESVFSKPKVKS